MDKTELNTFIKKEIQTIAFVTVKDDESLIKSKTLDSISLVDLAVAIEEKTGVKITASEINESNFDTVTKIIDFVNKKENG